jgi:uncharacterized protein DUF2846
MKTPWASWAVGMGTLLLLAGCAATGPAFQEAGAAPKDKATVYVYRPSSLVNSGNAPNLFVNDVDHGQLWNAGYIPLSLPPGEISVVLKGDRWKWGLPPISTKARVEAGKSYYFRMGNTVDFADYSGSNKESTSSRVVTPVLGSSIQIQQVPADYGRKEIANTSLSGPR